MKRLWLVAWNEIRRNVFKKSFIFVLLSVPLMIGVNVGIGLIMESLEDSDAPLGYVDHSGLLAEAIQPTALETEESVELIAFASEDEARQAVESDRIQAYYVLAPDYEQTNQIELVYLNEPGENATQQFQDFLRINLLRDFPEEVALRAVDGSHVTIRSPDGTRVYPEGGPPLSKILLLIIAFAFVILVMMSSGYLMGGLAEEKQNRTMDVLVTSVSPGQMIAGKIVGIVCIGLIQLVAWAAVGVLAVIIGDRILGIAWFHNPQLEWGAIFRMLAVAVPTYVWTSALMFALGATVVEAQEGQSVGALFFLAFMLPFYMLIPLIETPNGALATALTLLPFTSPMTIALRSMFFTVPLWQVVLSTVIQSLLAVGAIWLAGWAFRLGMLRYGKRLKLGEVLGMIRRRTVKASVS
jgi:ABC-2 type transport system permease protein